MREVCEKEKGGRGERERESFFYLVLGRFLYHWSLWGYCRFQKVVWFRRVGIGIVIVIAVESLLGDYLQPWFDDW